MTANGRKITFTGHKAFNGIVHELNGAAMDYVYERNSTILSELEIIPRFGLYVDYVKRNGLTGPLTSKDFAFTVLVPNNE